MFHHEVTKNTKLDQHKVKKILRVLRVFVVTS